MCMSCSTICRRPSNTSAPAACARSGSVRQRDWTLCPTFQLWLKPSLGSRRWPSRDRRSQGYSCVDRRQAERRSERRPCGPDDLRQDRRAWWRTHAACGSGFQKADRRRDREVGQGDPNGKHQRGINSPASRKGLQPRLRRGKATTRYSKPKARSTFLRNERQYLATPEAGAAGLPGPAESRSLPGSSLMERSTGWGGSATAPVVIGADLTALSTSALGTQSPAELNASPRGHYMHPNPLALLTT